MAWFPGELKSWWRGRWADRQDDEEAIDHHKTRADNLERENVRLRRDKNGWRERALNAERWIGSICEGKAKLMSIKADDQASEKIEEASGLLGKMTVTGKMKVNDDGIVTEIDVERIESIDITCTPAPAYEMSPELAADLVPGRDLSAAEKAVFEEAESRAINEPVEPGEPPTDEAGGDIDTMIEYLQTAAVAHCRWADGIRGGGHLANPADIAEIDAARSKIEVVLVWLKRRRHSPESDEDLVKAAKERLADKMGAIVIDEATSDCPTPAEMAQAVAGRATHLVEKQLEAWRRHITATISDLFKATPAEPDDQAEPEPLDMIGFQRHQLGPACTVINKLTEIIKDYDQGGNIMTAEQRDELLRCAARLEIFRRAAMQPTTKEALTIPEILVEDATLNINPDRCRICHAIPGQPHLPACTRKTLTEEEPGDI